MWVEHSTLKKSTKLLAPFGLVALLVALWWMAVTTSRSLIFPAPGQMVLGMVELIQQGLLLTCPRSSRACALPLEWRGLWWWPQR